MASTLNGDNANFPGKVTTAELKVTGGTPGAGKVLTSDADGDATWAASTASIASGSHNIGNGVSTETITGLGLAIVPTAGVVTVRMPAGGLLLFAVIEAGSISADGFTFWLSGTTDSANYYLDYILF